VTVGADTAATETLGAFGMRGHVTIRDIAFAPAAGNDGSAVIPAYRLDPPRMFRLHAEEALTAAELEAAAVAHTRGERLVMHAAETQHRLELVRSAFGLTTVRLLAHHGLLSERMLLSHAVHVDAEERELLARTRTCIIASPAAEMKLADGIAPIADYIAAGMTVALGTDSAVCNNGNDMFLECRQLGLAQKLAHGANVLPADRILRCATRDGACALGESQTYGAIVPGLSADVILVDTSSPRLQPLVHRDTFTNVAANLVYAATAQDVTDVLVRGRWCVRDRRLVVADQDRLWEELARAAASLHDTID
jgi:5-methylthioadenosine/S-adenosylhomocysteine deaminase